MADAAATSLGNALREERLKKKLDLATVAKQTRICAAILEAIEDDRFDRVPGGAYRRHFLHQYACALGMDGDAVVAEFKKEHEEPPVPLPNPPKRRRSSVWADLAWAFAVVASLAGAFEIAQNKHSALKYLERVAMKPEGPPPVESGKPAEAAAPATVPPPAPASPPETPPAPPQAPVHVAFTATEPVWVSVKCDGHASYAGVLEVPQSRTFDATATVTALIENAGGLRVSVNGKPIGPLGAHGEVEMVELTPQGARRIEHRSRSADDPAPAPHL